MRLSAEAGADLALAELWLALEDRPQATRPALDAYRVAWADGEPYVRRSELERATALLDEVGVRAPALPAYDPAEQPPQPWEAEVRAAIEALRANRTRVTTGLRRRRTGRPTGRRRGQG